MPDGAHPRIVTDDGVERALSYLRDSAQAIGAAKERMVLTSKMREHVLALEMKKHDGSAAAQEREAKASDKYKEAIIDEAKAAGAYEYMRALREAAAAKIEAWRTEAANFRALTI
jgi:hypothetical protein